MEPRQPSPANPLADRRRQARPKWDTRPSPPWARSAGPTRNPGTFSNNTHLDVSGTRPAFWKPPPPPVADTDQQPGPEAPRPPRPRLSNSPPPPCVASAPIDQGKNLTPAGHASFRLPPFSPVVLFVPRKSSARELQAVTDTILIEPDRGIFSMTARVSLPMRKSCFDLSCVVAGQTAKDSARPAALRPQALLPEPCGPREGAQEITP